MVPTQGMKFYCAHKGRERCVTFSKETHLLDGVDAAKVTWLGGTGLSRLQSDERQ